MLHSSDANISGSEGDKQKLCHTFTEFFVSKIINLKLTINSKLKSLSTSNFPCQSFTGEPFNHMPPVPSSEVITLLSSMSSKSFPMDFIPISLLKSCSGHFSDFIADLTNLSFSLGQFPSLFELAQVTPLLKNPVWTRTSPQPIVRYQISTTSSRL